MSDQILSHSVLQSFSDKTGTNNEMIPRHAPPPFEEVGKENKAKSVLLGDHGRNSPLPFYRPVLGVSHTLTFAVHVSLLLYSLLNDSLIFPASTINPGMLFGFL